MPASDPTARSADIDRLERALAQLIRRANTPRVQQRLTHRTGVPLDRALYLTLAHIGERERIRLTDLAQDLGVDISTSSRQVRDLEDRGLVSRCGDDRDRRVAQLSLTRGGQSLLATARAARVEALANVVGDWAGAEVGRLAALLERLVEDLNRAVDDQGSGETATGTRQAPTTSSAK